ncbi:MAG: Ig-like domain-containing domain [Fibrobacteraceae bacterium]
MKSLSPLFLCVPALLIGCATVVAPSGGPEDKLPPRVAAVSPAPNAVNQSRELAVKVQFDEWINSTVSRSAVTISPPIEKKLRFEVDGDLLSITSKSKLDSNTTYTLTVGSGLKDLHGNAVAKPFQIVFSTGSSIDSLSVSGRVSVTPAMIKQKQYPTVGLFPVGKERSSRRYLAKYRDTTGTVPDSVPRLDYEPPLFATQSDSNGWFRLGGLRPGHYQVVSFVDANGNQRIEPSVEWAGVADKDLNLTPEMKDSLWIVLADQDTSLLSLESVTQAGAYMLSAKFLRNIVIDSDFVRNGNCRLTAKDSSRRYPAAVFRNTKDASPMFYFNPAPAWDSTYTFSCGSAADSLGRKLDPRLNSLSITWEKIKNDTLPPAIVAVTPANGIKNVFPKEPAVIAYDKPFAGDSLRAELFAIVNRDTLPVAVTRLDTARFEVRAYYPWPTDAKVNLVQAYMDTTLKAADSNGVRDTVIERKMRSLTKFETVAKLKLASLYGVIPGGKLDTRARLRSVETGKDVIVPCDATGTFRVSDLLEGSYLLDYYRVKQGSDVPFAGKLSPMEPGLPWRAAADTVKIVNGPNTLSDLVKNLPVLP